MVRSVAAHRLRPDDFPALRRRLHDPDPQAERPHEGPRDRHRLGLSDGDPELPRQAGLYGRAVSLAAARRRGALPDAPSHNITTIAADGTKGWPKQAPFERIIVTAAAKIVPQPLLDQLADGGIMVIPVEVQPGRQEIQRIVKNGDDLDIAGLLPVRFVPLLTGMPPEV